MTCSRCNAALVAGAQFCGSCGAPQGAAPPTPPIPQPPPYPAPPPPPFIQAARSLPSAGAGTTKQANFNGSAQDAYNQALNSLTATNASSKGVITSQVTSQHPPQAARFETICKSFWATLGFAIKYDGDIQIQTTGPNQVAARYNLKLQWNSAIGLILTQGATAVIAIMLNPYYAGFAIFLILGVMAFTAWNVSSGVPEKALEQFVRNLQSGSAAPVGGFQPSAPAPQAFTPQPAPTPTPAPSPTPAPQSAPTAGGDSAVVMEQIKQLGSLRDAGVLTPEEFEAKKAELLKRI